MYLVILGLNIWTVLFFSTTIWTGFGGTGFPFSHIQIALFSLVFACLSQCLIFCMAVGSSKLLKEKIGQFQLDLGTIDEVNKVLLKLFPLAWILTACFVLTGILGVLAHSDLLPLFIHRFVAIGTYLFIILSIPKEYQWIKRLYEINQKVNGSIEKQKERGKEIGPYENFIPDRVDFSRSQVRSRFLLGIGVTLLFISARLYWINEVRRLWLLAILILIAILSFFFSWKVKKWGRVHLKSEPGPIS